MLRFLVLASLPMLAVGQEEATEYFWVPMECALSARPNAASPSTLASAAWPAAPTGSHSTQRTRAR